MGGEPWTGGSLVTLLAGWLWDGEGAPHSACGLWGVEAAGTSSSSEWSFWLALRQEGREGCDRLHQHKRMKNEVLAKWGKKQRVLLAGKGELELSTALLSSWDGAACRQRGPEEEEQRREEGCTLGQHSTVAMTHSRTIGDPSNPISGAWMQGDGTQTAPALQVPAPQRINLHRNRLAAELTLIRG